MVIQRDIVIKTNNEAEVSVEELYKLEQAAFQKWTEAGLYTPISNTSIERLQRYIADKAVFIAQDEATGELLGMHTLKLNKRNNWGRFLDQGLSVASLT